MLVAGHFQYRVEIFFKITVFDEPLGMTNYYATSFEFQIKESPLIHSFIWILNAPYLLRETKGEYIFCLDTVSYSHRSFRL